MIPKSNAVCPDCGEKGFVKEEYAGSMIPDWICTKCGYVGHWGDFSTKKNDSDLSKKDSSTNI
jgi:ribosomal protein L37AE/L43A